MPCRREVDGRALVVSFDDAFASVHRLAFPILASLGLVGTMFAPSAFMPDGAPLSWPGVDHWRSGRHAAEMGAMTWTQLGELQAAGWEIGSHTVTHPHLTALDDDALRSELSDSRHAIIQALGRCDTIAYPYGDVDARVVAAAQRCGYTAGAALSRALTERGPYLWPRVGVYHLDSGWRFAMKTSSGVRSPGAPTGGPPRSERDVGLIYHDIASPQEIDVHGFPGPVAARYKLSPERFEAHLDAIDATGVDVAQFSAGGQAAITFDDGGSSALLAASALEARGWRGSFFITTGRIGSPGFLTAEQVRGLVQRGHEMGSHSARTRPTWERWTGRGWRASGARAGPICGASSGTPRGGGGARRVSVPRGRAGGGARRLPNAAHLPADRPLTYP